MDLRMLGKMGGELVRYLPLVFFRLLGQLHQVETLFLGWYFILGQTIAAGAPEVCVISWVRIVPPFIEEFNIVLVPFGTAFPGFFDPDDPSSCCDISIRSTH